MEEFKLSDKMDGNKVFIVYRSELEERFDSEFIYQKRNLFQKFHYPLKKIKHYFIVKDGDHDKLPEGELCDESTGKRYLRAQDIKNGKILSEKPIYVSKKYFDKIKRCQIQPGDLLISIMASLGLNAIVPENFEVSVANRAVGILRPKSNDLLITSYLQVLLNTVVGFSLFEIQKKGGLQQRLNLTDISNVSIPIPPEETQRKIVKIYNNARILKQEKEAEATALLNSIDSYLLGELGISFPNEEEQERELLIAAELGRENGFELDKENLLVKNGRLFLTSFLEVMGQRISPLAYYCGLEYFKKGKYLTQQLKNIIASFKSGIGAGKQNQASDDNGYIQIRPTNIGEYGILLLDKNVFLPYDSKVDFLALNDVLFNNTNSQELVGKTAILKTSGEMSYSNHITVIKVKPEILNPDYLCQIFNCFQRHKIFYSICTNWNNQSGVGLDLLKTLEIPLPPIKKQKIIASQIHSILYQATNLQQEAESILEAAKQQVQQMILDN